MINSKILAFQEHIFFRGIHLIKQGTSSHRRTNSRASYDCFVYSVTHLSAHS